MGKGLIKEENVLLDSCFVKGGFTNWQKATEKFKEHEKSKLHSEALQKISALKTTPVNALLSDAARQGQDTTRRILELMFRSVLFLEKKMLAFRSDGSRDGVLYELMLERTYNLPKEREWILRRDNWLPDTIQNEVIQQYACTIQSVIVSHVSNCPNYRLTGDGTMDASTMGQFSLMLHYVWHTIQYADTSHFNLGQKK